MDTLRSLVPSEFRIDGLVSDKALYYMDDLPPGTVITLDDVALSDQMQEVLKGVTSSFQKPFPYRTVNKDRKPQTCIIPERCVWWLAKVEGAGLMIQTSRISGFSCGLLHRQENLPDLSPRPVMISLSAARYGKNSARSGSSFRLHSG